MFGAKTTAEDIEATERDSKRLDEPVTVTVRRGTIETILRNFRGEPHRYIGLMPGVLPPQKQRAVNEAALEDLLSALDKARS